MTAAERIRVFFGAVVAIVLQVVLAPHIGLFGAVPNFLVVYAMTVAVVRARSYGSIMPFLLGLFFDLFTGGPVGAMALALMVVTVVVARVFEMLDNDTLFMPLATLAVGVLLVDLAYAALLLMFGYPAGFFEAIAYRVIPCFVYDLVLTLAFFPLARRLFAFAGAVRTELTQLR